MWDGVGHGWWASCHSGPPFWGGIHFVISSVSNIMKSPPPSVWGTQFLNCVPSTVYPCEVS